MSQGLLGCFALAVELTSSPNVRECESCFHWNLSDPEEKVSPYGGRLRVK